MRLSKLNRSLPGTQVTESRRNGNKRSLEGQTACQGNGYWGIGYRTVLGGNCRKSATGVLSASFRARNEASAPA
jgi:hypothetical protein